MKPREFWMKPISTYEHTGDGDYRVYTFAKPDLIHVREILPINWDYIWATMNQEFLYQVMNLDFVKRYQDRLQELIEEQICGDLEADKV